MRVRFGGVLATKHSLLPIWPSVSANEASPANAIKVKAHLLVIVILLKLWHVIGKKQNIRRQEKIR